MYYVYSGRKELLKLLRLFETSDNISGLTVYHPDFKPLRKALRSCFRIIKAAGGLIQDEQGNVLMIYRRNMWDLPKGKMEKFETYEKTALREVKEECGLSEPHNPERLTTTYHVYRLNGKPVLKKTMWFRMSADGKAHLKPQTEEEITRICWFSDADLKKDVIPHTYANIKIVLEAAGYHV